VMLLLIAALAVLFAALCFFRRRPQAAALTEQTAGRAAPVSGCCGSFREDYVAKLLLIRLTHDDSVGLRRASAGAAHDGSAAGRTASLRYLQQLWLLVADVAEIIEVRTCAPRSTATFVI